MGTIRFKITSWAVPFVFRPRDMARSPRLGGTLSPSFTGRRIYSWAVPAAPEKLPAVPEPPWLSPDPALL